MPYSEERQILVAGCRQLGLQVTDNQIEALIQYLALFDKWNRAYNLSAIRESQDMVRLHLLDSLSIVPHIRGERLIDVGTGGGLPGIPLAILYPEKSFTLLDSAGKKTRFLVQVRQDLGLDNVIIENRRIESFKPQPLFDGVISRAFASLQDMTKHCRHVLKPGGAFFAMKGQMPVDELSEIQKHYSVEGCHSLTVPGVEAQRCLLIISPLADGVAQPASNQ